MKRRLLKGITAGLVGIMTMGLVGCGSLGNVNGTTDSASSKKESESETEGEKETYKIGVVVKTTSNAYFREIAYGAVKAGEAYGIEVIPMATTSEGDISGQIQLCEDLISRGVDALIVTPQNSEGIATAVQAAKDAGVEFIAVDTMVAGDAGKDVPSYIGLDHGKTAEAVATEVFEKMGGKGNVVILEGMAGASSSIERTAGFYKAAENYPDIKIVADQNADYEQDKAQMVLSDILQANKDINAVLCCNDIMGLGAITALEEAGYTVGEGGVTVAGIDGTIVGLEAVKEGKLYATAYIWGKCQGMWAVDMARQLLQGGNVPQEITSPYTVIKKDTVEEYIPFAEELSKYNF